MLKTMCVNIALLSYAAAMVLMLVQLSPTTWLILPGEFFFFFFFFSLYVHNKYMYVCANLNKIKGAFIVLHSDRLTQSGRSIDSFSLSVTVLH